MTEWVGYCRYCNKWREDKHTFHQTCNYCGNKLSEKPPVTKDYGETKYG